MNFKRINWPVVAIAMIYIILGVMASFWIFGCSNFKVTFPDGTEILYQNVAKKYSASGVVLCYVDPNGVTFWVNLSDPNSMVNPFKLKATEPYTGIGVEGETK